MRKIKDKIEERDFNLLSDYNYSITGKEWLRQKARKKDKILEISPGLDPICRKEDYPDVYYIDVYEEDYLETRASNTPGLDVNMGENGILKVAKLDMIMGKKSFRDTINDFGFNHADIITSSHVFEHIPDPIEFLKVSSEIINDDGQVIMLVPDKRFSFDLYRPVTTFGEWYEAYIEHRTINSLRSRVDVGLYNASHNERGAWARSDFYRATINPEYANIKNKFKEYIDAKEYFDCHASVMTPESLHLNLIECFLLELIDLNVVEIKSFENDIGVILKKTDIKKLDSLHLDRLYWLRTALLRNLYQYEHNSFSVF